MRKQTKLVAVLSAAALLAIGASMTSFAAKGWTEENGTWYYYNTDDDYATGEWKKSGNNWFWLDDDGAMATNTLVEDGDNTYYVNANGAMVTNSWVAVEPGDNDNEDDAPDHYWYYFGSNGRAVKDSGSSTSVKKKSINGKTYGFDQDGKMLYGWVSDQGDKITDESPFSEALYYFGDSDDGAMHTGWLQYNDGSDLKDEYNDLSEMWFYFDTSTGKKKHADAEDSYVDKTVNGRKYRFDVNGVMMSEWGWASVSTASNKYFNADTDGHMTKKGWIWAVPDEDFIKADYDDDTYRWFYAEASGNTVKNTLKKINGKKYLFDSHSRMRAGLVVVDSDKKYQGTVKLDETDGSALRDTATFVQDDSEFKSTKIGANETLYYFGDEETDGSMKTGKNVKVEFQDDTYTMAFETSGKAMNKKDGSKLYKNGFLMSASSDDKYEFAPFSDEAWGNPDKAYLVGTSGSIVKKGKYVKDADDNYYAVYGADAAANTTLVENPAKGTAATEPTIAKFSDSDSAKDQAREYAKWGVVCGHYDAENDKWVSGDATLPEGANAYTCK